MFFFKLYFNEKFVFKEKKMHSTERFEIYMRVSLFYIEVFVNNGEINFRKFIKYGK